MISSSNGEDQRARILIDSGSELSFITEDLVSRLGLRRSKAALPLFGIGGTNSGRTRGHVTLTIHSIHDASISFKLGAYVLPRITFELPTFHVPGNAWHQFRELQLADPEFYAPRSVDVILGADAYGHVIRPEIIQANTSALVAQNTILGWIISGPVKGTTTAESIESYHCSIDRQLHDLLKKFWEQEDLHPASTSTLSPEDLKCEEHFRATHSRDETGRYVVRLPLKEPPDSLGNSSAVALNCLHRLHRRFEKDPAYYRLYAEFMQEYRSLGHMEPVPSTEINDQPSYYLPHHGVYRESSQTTKLRVVFNGSSRSDNGLTMNDILHAGPKLQTDIVDVLLWFRQHQIVFSTDIVKMYRQIQVHKSDRNLQRIYWYDAHRQPKPHRLTTVTYGLNCAPYLALRVMEQLIADEGSNFPQAVPALKRGRYVDDIFGGADSVDETVEIINQLTNLCMAGGFPLQKWSSNCKELLQRLPLTLTAQAKAVPLNSSEVKVLGLCWHPEEDELQFTSGPTPNRSITKRTILSEIAQLYDPLGLISPVVIRAKSLLQELWIAKVGWDETLPSELQARWNAFRQDLTLLSKIKIPRWLHLSSRAIAVELHGFSDASQLAMAAVVYLRVDTEEGPSVSLICAKTKVAPLKRMTIPRLELTAAVMLSRLTNRVQRSLELLDYSIYLWTDSAVALTWITTHPSRWKEFVRNRATVIQETTPTAIWNFVPGKENPADCASRGLDCTQLQKHSLWWAGPEWLCHDRSNWPRKAISSPSDANLEENPRCIITNTRTVTATYWDLITRFSTLKRLLRITALCRRAAARFRATDSPSLDNPLKPSELKQSLQFWIRLIQQAHFQGEISILSNGELLPRSNPLIRLTPFLDGDGLLRVGGRLDNAHLDPDAKHPYILPRHSPLTFLIIADSHTQTLHGGTQITLAHIRQTFWILGGRAPVRSYILRCVRCARFRKHRAQQLMGQLPPARVTPARPFLNSGVDYAGPITIKTWRGRAAKTYKEYLAIFICLSTSAVHLEVVTDYSTEAFLAAYKRFCSRRGICATLHSDCGTNFVGADAELRRLFSSASRELRELASLLANCGTEWKFIPPAAPHFGGVWEAAVKSTKFHLRRVIGDSILTYEELSTLIVQIEAILNSRPICPMSDDSEDFSILTPGHFLIGEAIHSIPEPSFANEPPSRLSRWQAIRQKIDLFWKRWTAECLQRYQAISKWHHPSTELRKGAMVLLSDERYPPTKWPLARIVELHPGKDGLARVATIKTPTAIIKRPITKLCILPIELEERNFGNNVSEGGRKNV